MKRILTAVVLIPLVLLVVFKAPLWVFAVVTGVFALLAANEYLLLAQRIESTVARFAGLIAVAAIFGLLTWAIGQGSGALFTLAIGAVGLFYPFLCLILSMRSAELRTALPAAAMGSFVVPYVVFPLFSLVFIRSHPMGGWFFILWLFVMVWAGDIFAYYVGKNFGRHLLAPKISPKKTVEGTIASIIGSAAVSALLCGFAAPLQGWLSSHGLLNEMAPAAEISTITSIGVAVLVNIAAQLGDLAESALKRGAGVKDSGTLLPGHGGVLDRIDALLFAVPVLLIFLFFRDFAKPTLY